MNAVNIELEDTDASKIAEVMMHLAALIDPDDPDGLRDAFGRRNESLERHLLTNAQFVMLRRPKVASAATDTRPTMRLASVAV